MALPDIDELLRQLNDQQDSKILDDLEFATLGRVRENPADRIRCQAADLLGKSGDGRAAEPLCKALKDRSAAVRQAAAAALEKIGIPADPKDRAWYWVARQDWQQAFAEGIFSIGPLYVLLMDKEHTVRLNAALTLGKIWGKSCDPRVLPVLCRQIKSRIPYMRWVMVIILGEIIGKSGDCQARKLLCEALMDPVAEVRQAAAEALEKVGIPSDPATQAAYWVAKKDWDRAADAGAYAVEPLCALLSEERFGIDEAIVALGKIGDSRAVGLLCAVMEFAFSSRVAAEALVKIGKPAVPALIKLLQSYNIMARVYAAQALGKIKDPSAIEPLLLALKNSLEGRVRVTARDALEAIKGDKFK